MKILTTVSLYPPNVIGGAEILTKNLVEALGKSHEVFVLTSSCHYRFPEYVFPLLQRWNPDNPPSFLNRFLVRCKNYAITRKVLKTVNPDAVLLSDLEGLSSSPLQVAQKVKPTVTFLHDRYSFAEARPARTRGKLLECLACLAVFGRPIQLQHAISNSRSTIDNQPTFVSVNNSTVVGVGIPLPIHRQATERQTPTKTKRILYLGRIVREKGVHHAIHALKEILDEWGIQNAQLDIVGFSRDHIYLNELKNLARHLHLENHITFVENVTEEVKYHYYFAADVFVFPSI
jgi:glycosyltransferase involved in cell wall biosynthesis